MENRIKRVGKVLSLALCCILLVVPGASAQTVSFTSGILSGESLTQPTSLQFGPDGRLYVAQQNGKIFAYTVTRTGTNNYQVTATEQIDLIQQIPNHNDNGTLNATVTTRQVTGILLTGTAANPVLYVTSSDPRVGGGSNTNNDINLDTNSGVVSRLTWNGTTWVKVDLVRGLPRSEENHSVNGLAIDKVNNILYLAQGSNTNMGAPSNNFAYLPEYAYSTAILKIDLNVIGNTTYDLPTLDDESRSNVSGADVNDPFGGNDGLNQAKLVAGGPVSIYSPGWRNNYDLVITKANKMYSFDNGPNGGWGGAPISCTNQTSEPGSTYCDGLHYVSSQGYYAGFPNPTRASRTNTFNTTNPQSPVPLGMENPAECTYNLPGSNGSLTTICSSTNGMFEYTASNFGNAMKGDLLATAFSGKVYRFKLNAGGNALASGGQTILASNFGSIPLDVTTQGDNDIFPGTIWVAMYGSNDIVIFEPNDFATCAGDANNMSQDDDGDGYSNGDETQNLTDKCSAASKPADFDADYLSDLIDADDDNDGILDNVDKFAQDANNGTATTIPVIYTYQNTNNGGIGGWGFTGMMCNNIDNYMTHYDMDNMTVGGAAYKFTVDNVPAGDALGALNTQHYAYQLGLNVGAFPFGYIISSRVMGPFAGIPVTNFRSMGMFMGTGDQDNYLKMVCAANGGAGGIEIVKEVAGVATSTIYNVPILGSTHVNLYMTVNPTTQTVQPSYTIGGGAKTDLGPAVAVPASWISNVLAVGFISTSRGTTPFSATWDNISVQPVDGVGQWVAINTTNTCTARMENAFCQAGDKFILLGGRGTVPAESYNYITKSWTAGSNPPMQLHHFQAVEMNGLIYVVGAFTGNYPNETPVPNVYIYDPKTNVWHVGMDIPAARRRGSAAAIAHNGKIYVVSGLTNGHISGWVPYMDEFDPTTNTWQTLPDAPHSRDHFQIAIHNNKIYCIGGRNSGFGGSTFAATIPETDIYDIANNEWTTLESPEGDIPTQRAGVSVVTFGDEILVIGGESMAQNNAHDQTEALDCNTHQWRTLDNLVAGRHATQAIVNNFGIYTAAGSSIRGSSTLNSVEAFYLYGQTTPTGTAITKGALTLSSNNLSFGQISLGNSTTKTLYITNPGGNQALLIKGLSMSGGGNFSFTSPVNAPVALNPGDTLAVGITFMPASVGTKNGTFTISHSGTNGVNTIVNLTGDATGTQSSVRINCGGPQYTTAAAEAFIADAYYAGSTSTGTTSQAIGNTTEDALYQTERYGNNFSYNAPIQNGSYTVKLHFAEIWSGGSNAGVRVFDVKIENALVIDDLDIYSVAGTYNALVRTFNVSVSDGTMNIDFISSVNNAKVNAIEIIAPINTQGILTAVPSPVSFPQTDVNVISQPMALSLTNTGGAILTINSVSISGTNASNFLHSFSSPVTLAVGATATISITFTPSASGLRTATMNINHTGSNSPLSVSLSGRGSSITSSCGYYAEQNGLLVMEIESASASQGWTSETTYPDYTGTEYYTWTGPNYFHEKGHGMLTYQFKINNPGKYRFKMRTRNGGPLNTHNNDVWVRFPDHGCTFEKNGQVQSSASGWWKQWQNNLGVWTYNSWAGESTFWEVYVEFPFAGVYTMDISGRAQLYSLDRIVFYRMDMMTDWAATSANPPASPWENCPATPLVWYKDADRDYYGSRTDSVISVSKPGVGYVWNKLDCDDGHGKVYPGAPEILDGRDNDCDGIKDENAYLTALNINSGGSTYTSVAGDVFESDRLYSLPSSAKYYSGIGNILNTDDDVMYKSERVTNQFGTSLSYNLKCKSTPTVYTVSLFWAEQDAVTTPGQRVMNVMVEDSMVLKNLDIIDSVGYKTALSYTIHIPVFDSMLNIKVMDVTGKAKLNAVKAAKKPNVAPTFTISGNSTVNEDFAGVKIMTVVPTPVPSYEAFWQTTTYSLSPASVPFANVSINPATGEVQITAIPDMVGTQQFTIIANDAQPENNLATKTFTLKVLAVNDAPAFTLSGDVNVNEDFAGTQTVSVTPVTVPADEVSQVVTYALSPASVSFANVSINSSTGAVSISAVAEKSGSQMFTVTANDGQSVNNTYSKTFTLTVNQVNDAPMMDAISDITINEDAAMQTVTMSGISAGPLETQTISVSSVSDNVTLIANPAVTYISANATGSMNFSPVANKSGVAHITVTVSDGSLSFDRMFTVTVNSVNDAPMFTMGGDVTVNEDFVAAQHVAVTPGAVAADEVSQVVAYSMTPLMVSFANVSLNSSTGEVTITSIANASGSQAFTVTANDGQSQNNTYSQTFTLTVNAVNDAPAFTLSGNVTVNEDFAAAQQVTAAPAVVPADETSQVVSYSLSPSSVSFANVSINSVTGEVTITSIANASGSQIFTVTANDGQTQNNTYSQTFTLTVNSVNDAPVFTLSGNVAVNEDFGTVQHVTVTPAAVTADETSQVVTYSMSPSTVSFANVSINSNTGEVTISSIVNTSGNQVFTVTANDGQSQNNTFSQTFTLTVNSVNDAPAFTLSGNVTVNEDFAATQQVTAAPAVVPADEASQVVTYSMTPLMVNFANVSLNSSTGEVTITSIANASGSQAFTVTANDGQSQNDTYSQNFTLTVNAVNDAPAFTLSGNVTVNEDFAEAQQVTAAPAVVPADETSQVVSYSLSPSSVSFANVSINNSTGEVTITSIANASGSQLFTVTANDGQTQNNTYSQTFTLTVNSVNDAPAFTLSGNVTVNEDFAATQQVTVSPAVVPADEISQLVTYSLSPASISFANVSISSSTGQVTITSIANASGSQIFTVTANDGQSQNNTYSQSFTLTVNSVNDAPAFTLSGNVTVNEDFAAAQQVTVTPGAVAADEASQVVTYSMTPLTVSFANVSLNSSTGEVTITSIANASGSQAFTVTANDGQSQNDTYSQNFTLTVNAVNDAPAFTLSGNVTVNEDFAAAQQVTAAPAVVPANETSQVVTYSLSPSSVSFANVSINSVTGEVTITSIANASGSQIFTVTANDGQTQNNTYSQTFTLTVNSVNDAPAFTLSGNVTVNEDFATVQHVTVTNAAVPTDEASQVVTYSMTPSTVSFANVSINSNTGEVTISSIVNTSGTQVFTVTANDGQSQNNTFSQTFTLTVNSVNDAPAFTLSGNVTVNEDFVAAQQVILTPASIPADEMSQSVTYNMSPASVSFANVSLNSSTGEVTITAVPNAFGTQMFTVTANDGQSQNNTHSQTFTLTVNSVNDAPAFTLSGNVTVNENFATAQHVTVTPATLPTDEMSQAVTYSMSPSSVSFANVSINSNTGEITISSVTGAFGSQMFTVTANDGQAQNNTFLQTFTLAVNSVNNAPAFTLSGDVTMNEDFATVQHVTVSPAIVPVDELSQVVTYSMSPSSVSFANVSLNSSTGEVTITAIANASGNQMFTVTANDGQPQNSTYAQAFTLAVNSVNDVPVFTVSGGVAVNEDFSTTESVTVTPGFIPSNELSQAVVYSLSPASVSFANVSINSGTGKVTITSVVNASGTQIFMINANDGQSQNNTYSRTFTLIVNSVNDAPEFALSGGVTVNEDFASVEHVTVIPSVVPANETSQVVNYSISPLSVSFANVSINGSTGEVAITSILNASGSQLFTVTANDGQSQSNTYTRTFMLTVNPVNDAPVFTLSGDVTVNEDFATAQHVMISPAAIPANEMSQAVTYSMTPTTVSFANVSINSNTGEVTITSVANLSGTQVFTITANDGQSQNNTYSKTFTLTVVSVNDAPVFTLSGNVTVVEGQYTSATVSVTQGSVPANEMTQIVTYTLSPSSVGIANVSINSSTGEVTITSVLNQFGTQLFTVTANDGQSQNNSYSQTFTLIIEEGNNPPSFTTSGDVIVDEDFATSKTVIVTPGPVRPFEASQVVTYTLSPSSVGFANISFDSNTGKVTITSVANAYGSQQFTITANDGQNRNNLYSSTFMLTVNSVNDVPVFTLSGDINESEDFVGTRVVTVTKGFVPANETSQAVSYSISPSVSFANVSINPTTGDVSISSILNASGSQMFTVTANDGQSMNNSYTAVFTLTVNPVNDQPTLNPISNPSAVLEDSGLSTVSLSGISAGGGENQTLTVTAVSNNPSLLTLLNVNYTNPATIGTISFQPAPNMWGSATITVLINDGQSVNNTISRTFDITVTSVNDAPVFTTTQTNVIVAEDFTLTQTVSAIPMQVPADEAVQVVRYSLSPASVPFANIQFNNATGEVKITSVPNASGSGTFTVTANDGQSQNSTHAQTFILTVNSVNDAPVFSINHSITVLKNFASNEIFTVTPAPVPANEVIQTVTYSLNPASVSFANISFSSMTGSVSITSISNMSGSQTFTLTANDGQSANNLHSEQFVFTVIDTNYQPTLNAINNPAAINEDAGTQVIQLSGITSGFNEAQVITVTAVSDNPSLIPNPIVTYTNPADVGTINYAPLANQYGIAVITVTVNDGESENNIITKSFTVTVNPVNDQPTLNAINDPSAILEDAPMQTIMMSGISTGPHEFDALVITTSSSNPLLITAPAVVYNNPDATGMLQYTPVANQFGSALITVTVNDGKLVNNTFSRTFTVTVNSVDDAPVLSDIFKNGQEDKNLGFQVGNFKNSMTDVEGDTLVKIRIVSLPDNGRLLKNGNPISAMTELTIADINLLAYDPFDEFSGVDSFLWNGFAGSMYALNSAYVYLNINNVNDKPYVVSHIPDITVNEDAAAMWNYADLKNIFNDIEDGVNMTYTVIMNTNNSLADVVIDASQTLDISFVANANGNATVAIQAKDKDGSTITDTFKIVVNSVEDIPAIFNLLTPADGSAIANPNAIDFSWEASSDGDGDDLTYAITIRGHNLDTTISVVSATSVLLGGSSLFTMDSTYQWFVTASDGNDVRSSTPFRFKISVTAVNDPNALISTAEAYPNPFNSSARISYVLKADSRVTLKIYNLIGQEVETITNEDQLQGKHISLWDAKRETSGVYFYELTVVTKSGIQGSFKGQLIKQ